MMLLPVENAFNVLLSNLGGGRFGMVLRALLLPLQQLLARSLSGHLAFVVASIVTAFLLKRHVTLSHSWLLL